MTSTTRKLIWIKQLLSDLDITTQSSMKLFCDNQAACHIASNPLFHERTNHIKVDCHFIRDKIQLKKIETSLVRSEDQLMDIFTKDLELTPFDINAAKSELIDIYNPT
jgi:hypothetical protein